MLEVACCLLKCPEHGNKILIAQKKSDYPNWEFPGGKSQTGEHIYQTAVREIKEELGVEVLPITRINGFTTQNKVYKLIPIICLLPEKSKIHLTEHGKIDWVNPSEDGLTDRLVSEDKRLLKEYLKFINRPIEPFYPGASGLSKLHKTEIDWKRFIAYFSERNPNISLSSEPIENIPNRSYLVYQMNYEHKQLNVYLSKYSPHFAIGYPFSNSKNTFIDLPLNLVPKFNLISSYLLNTTLDADEVGVAAVMSEVDNDELAWLSYHTPNTVGQFLFNDFVGK